MKPEVRLADQEHRDRAVNDLSESYIIEAAAGTGKTTVLVGRILNLIRRGEANLEEIVAITFTEKAAGELKVKLREELEKATLAASDSVQDHRLSKAISSLERMQVTTIHSFCASLLRERPVEAGLDPNFEVADELTASLLRTDVWDEWLAREMDTEDPSLRRAVLLGITTNQLEKLGQAMLNHRDVLHYLPSPDPKIEGSIDRFIKSLKEWMKELNRLKGQCKKPDEDRAFQKIEELNDQVVELESLPSEEEKEVFIFRKLSIGSTDRLGAQARWKTKEDLEEVRKVISQISEAVDEVKAGMADSVLTGLTKRLVNYVQSYEKAKQERNYLDFNDLLLYTRQLLKEHIEVRQYFRQRYKFLLVDEFQDTDPLQAEIVFFLSEMDKKTPALEWSDVKVSPKRLFLVGDPKQSIYRFRRADIEMYEDVKKGMGSERLLTISQNFRCAPSIVRVANKIFQELIQRSTYGDYQPDYVSLHFGRKQNTVPPQHGLVLLCPPEDRKFVFTDAEDQRTWESRCIASFIQKLVGEEKWQVWDESLQSMRPVGLRDVAILMRTYSSLEYLENALRSYDVDYRVVGGRYFYKRQEVEQLLAVLRAVDNPHDKVALIAALRSPFFGISDEEIFIFHEEGGELNYLKGAKGTPLEKPFFLLRELHEIRNQTSVAAVLHRFYLATRGLILFLLKPQGEQRVANLIKIGDVARALAERGTLSFRGFVRWLAERQEEEAEEEEPPTLERGDEFVKLMTIHRAKGLEFPVVILADLAHQGKKGRDFIVDRKGHRIAIKVGGQDDQFWTRNFEDLSKWEEIRGEAEERRLLYVAMTRARDFSVLPLYWVKDKNGEPQIPEMSFLKYLQDYFPRPGEVPFGQWKDDIMFYDTKKLELQIEGSSAFRSKLNPEMEGGEVSKGILTERIKWKNSKEELKKQAGKGRSITTATEEVKAAEEVEKDDEWLVSPVTRGEGAVFGKLVHQLFEKLDWSQPDLLEKMAEIEGKDLGATGSMIKRAGEMVREAINSAILQRVIKSSNYQKEVPFTYKNNGTIFEGVMDVVFKEGDGLVVLDFKTDFVKKDDLKSRIEHYKPQVRVYSDAIKTIFGKPPKEVILFFLHPMEPVSV
ncbi:MAG: UvrD-helicase domain-containing protein, partial [Syntrophaceae bacterium]|nr:UvrD-helicase domain-containing protein [Syntrophaceae bacterium]